MKTFTAIVLFLGLTGATPVALVEKDVAILHKRDTEIIYLADCVDAVSCCTPDVHTSQIIYYPASGQSHNGEFPKNDNACVASASGFANWQTTNTCTFGTGVTFWAHADEGWGNNGYKDWVCSADNDRILFEHSHTEAMSYCRSKYYCVPNSR